MKDLKDLRWLPVVPVTLLLMLSACSTSTSAPDPTASITPAPTSIAPTPTSTGDTSLTIIFVRKSTRDRVTLKCDPPGGTHPDPALACDVLTGVPDPFAPVPADAVCSQVYGGPEKAKVTGTYQGVPVDAEFSRTDGCEISRWDAIGPVINPKGHLVG